jgi:hypothetical protein
MATNKKLLYEYRATMQSLKTELRRATTAKNEDSKQLLTTNKSNKCSVYSLKFISLPTGLVKPGNTLKKNYGTHVIKLDIAPVAYPLGQHLFISASNNMFYRHSQ